MRCFAAAASVGDRSDNPESSSVKTSSCFCAQAKSCRLASSGSAYACAYDHASVPRHRSTSAAAAGSHAPSGSAERSTIWVARRRAVATWRFANWRLARWFACAATAPRAG